MTSPSDEPLPRLAARPTDSHKGDFGRALLIGGSRGMAGAIALSGISALRGGAGLVTVATADRCLETVAAHEPCLMTLALPDDSDGRVTAAARQTLEPIIDRFTCIACGPGLGRSGQLDELVVWLQRTVPGPLVLDADALNALSEHPTALGASVGPRLITPHPGEFRRLVGTSGELTDEVAKSFAQRYNLVLLLKGGPTRITDGSRLVVNRTGNPGLATAGSGDVLTGLITALVCQGLSVWDAARLGAHVHGRAGDLAASAVGQTTMLASDLPAWFGRAMEE